VKRAGLKRIGAIALGSNLASEFGGLEANLRVAVERVGALGVVKAVASFYDTEPVGYTEQPRFLNGAMLIETEMEPVELMRALLEIERGMGRVRGKVPAGGVQLKGPRVIDLDLLLMGDVAMETAELTLPHPAMRERRFVLEPLVEIGSEMVDPVTGKTVADLLGELG